MTFKNINILLAFVFLLVFTGCFETTQETEIKEDGSGILRTTNDMSSLIGLAKEMAGKDAEKMGEEAMDTTMSLATQVDSVEGLNNAEKELMKKGTVHIEMNLADDKFVTTLTFPFTSIEEIGMVQKLANKVSMQAIKNQMAQNPMGSDPFEETPVVTSFDDYYTNTYSNHLLVKTLDKEKFAKADSDKFLAAIKESKGMGIPSGSTYIIDLPHPATKADGKGLVLSEDKKKVTIKVDVDDFFDDPSKLEYRIEF